MWSKVDLCQTWPNNMWPRGFRASVDCFRYKPSIDKEGMKLKNLIFDWWLAWIENPLIPEFPSSGPCFWSDILCAAIHPYEGRRIISVQQLLCSLPFSGFSRVHSCQYYMSFSHWLPLASRTLRMCPKAGRPQGSKSFLLQEEVIDKARCHQVCEARADHPEERDDPFC